MKFNQREKNKKAQYIIGSIVAIIVLFIWLSIPLMNKSPLDASVPVGGFSKKSADLSMLSDSSGVDAPGSPLSGELIDNPSTNLDLAASSLFGSGVSENKENTSENTVSSNNTESITSSNNDSGSISYSGPKAKLQVLPPLTAGNSNSQTIGSTHNKFFGSNQIKPDLIPQNEKLDVKPKTEKAQALFAALKNAEQKSIQAAQAKNVDEARNSATTAFENNKKDTLLDGKDEKESSEAGMELGKVNQDLKKNDPELNKHKVTPPTPQADIDKDKTAEEMKKWLLQMLLQATVGQMFGAMGQMMAATIYPDYNAKK